ncbi:TolC family protein [Paraflavisolibacter sp. H34]|uniref:TolC family protein n=1 Tax=Huijunlia imazamoxiresistens TaxID=3127457 RepID=UPI0030192ECC
MIRQRLLPLFTLLLAAGGAFAQKPISLKEAIHYSLEHHGSNRIMGNQQEIARQQAREALSAYLPQVSASATVDDNIKRQSTVLPGAIFGAPGDIKVQMGNKYNSMANLQLDQTLYDQSLLYGLKAAGPNQKIAELNKKQNDEDLVFRTSTAYAQILILKEQQKLLDTNEKQYKDLYNITKFRFDKGVAKKVDLDRVQVNLNNISAQKKAVQSGMDVAYNSLKNAMGLPLSDQIVVEDSLDFRNYQSLPPAAGVQGRTDYQLAQQNILLQEIDVKRKQAAYLPTVSAYARYGGQAFGNELGKALTDWNDYSAIGLKLNIPIFSSRRRESQLKQSRLELENARQNLKLSEQNLELESQNAGRQLQESTSNLLINRNNMELAKSVYETSQFEYSKGVSTMSDLLNADFSYREAQSNYMTSLLNLVSSRLEYEKAKGTLQEFINQL